MEYVIIIIITIIIIKIFIHLLLHMCSRKQSNICMQKSPKITKTAIHETYAFTVHSVSNTAHFSGD